MNSHPGSYGLSIYRGDSYTWTFRVWEDEAHTVAIDLTGVEARAEVRVGTGQHVLECVITLPNVITVTLDAGRFVRGSRAPVSGTCSCATPRTWSTRSSPGA